MVLKGAYAAGPQTGWKKENGYLMERVTLECISVCTYMNCEENMFKKETGNCILV